MMAGRSTAVISSTIKTEELVAVLDVIQEGKTRHGFPPTLREMADMLSLSMSAVRVRLGHLNRLDFIKWQPGASRTITVTPLGREFLLDRGQHPEAFGIERRKHDRLKFQDADYWREYTQERQRKRRLARGWVAGEERPCPRCGRPFIVRGEGGPKYQCPQCASYLPKGVEKGAMST